MSQHIIRQEGKKYVFGWDQPLQTFYLQVHDLTRAEDEQIIAWLGVDNDTRMYELEQLVASARKHGLFLEHSYRVKLYADKDEGL